MEATIFTGWIYDHLLPHAEKVKIAHPLMPRASCRSQAQDRFDAAKIADSLRCDFLPECHMASTAIRDQRRMLRYRNLVVEQSVQMKNRISGLLMETGVVYNKQRLHKVGYFADLMENNEEIEDCIRPLLRLTASTNSLGKKKCLYKRFVLEWPIMPCWVHSELENEWKRLVENQVGAHSSGYDTPTVRLYWQMIEHRKSCEVCRDEETVRDINRTLGKR